MRAFTILAAAAALVAGCSQEPEQNEQAKADPTRREARVGPVGLFYDSTRLAIARVPIPLPGGGERQQVQGMKLIAKDREPLIDEGRCPDQPGNVCRAEAEGGLTLSVLNAPLAQLSEPIRRTSPVTVAGREGVTWEGRFGNKPATYTLLPVEQQTLMMIRQSGGEGAPDAATLDAVVSTLDFAPPPPQEEKGRR